MYSYNLYASNDHLAQLGKGPLPGSLPLEVQNQDSALSAAIFERAIPDFYVLISDAFI
jgi:hypothetical protein